MARVFFNNAGGVNPLTGANANINVVTFPTSTTDSSGFLLLTNDADSAVVGRINAETPVSLNGEAGGEDMDFRMDAKSYMLIPYTVTSAGGTNRRVDISTSHMFTAHRTSANSGEHVYLSIVQ